MDPAILQPIEQAAVMGAAAIVSAAAAVAAGYIRSHIKNQMAADALATATTQAGAVAYDALTTAVANGQAPNWAAAKAKAITEATATVSADVGTVLSPVAVTAALAPLLAADPTVPAKAAPPP